VTRLRSHQGDDRVRFGGSGFLSFNGRRSGPNPNENNKLTGKTAEHNIHLDYSQIRPPGLLRNCSLKKNRAPAYSQESRMSSPTKKAHARYLNPTQLVRPLPYDLLPQDGEHQEIPLGRGASIYSCAEFSERPSSRSAKVLSPPRSSRISGSRLRYSDGVHRSVVPNDIPALPVDNGIRLSRRPICIPHDRIHPPFCADRADCAWAVVESLAKPAAARADASHPAF